MPGLIRTLRFTNGYLSDRRGASLIEFALALPVFILGVVGILELALVLSAQVLAEGGLREAARYGITGQIPGGSSREAQILQIVSNHTHGMIDVSGATVTTKTYDSFDQVEEEEPYDDDSPANGQYDVGETFTDWNGNGTWDSDTGVAGPGASGEIVLYKIEFQWSFLTPLFSKFGGDDGKLDLSAAITVQNEPFTSVSGGSGG